jgi:hypothetical protein
MRRSMRPPDALLVTPWLMFAERIDADPWLWVLFRGQTQDGLLDLIRQHSRAIAEAGKPLTQAQAMSESLPLNRFWVMGDGGRHARRRQCIARADTADQAERGTACGPAFAIGRVEAGVSGKVMRAVQMVRTSERTTNKAPATMAAKINTTSRSLTAAAAKPSGEHRPHELHRIHPGPRNS